MDFSKAGDLLGKMGNMLGMIAPFLVYGFIAFVFFKLIKKKFFK